MGHHLAAIGLYWVQWVIIWQSLVSIGLNGSLFGSYGALLGQMGHYLAAMGLYWVKWVTIWQRWVSIGLNGSLFGSDGSLLG